MELEFERKIGSSADQEEEQWEKNIAMVEIASCWSCWSLEKMMVVMENEICGQNKLWWLEVFTLVLLSLLAFCLFHRFVLIFTSDLCRSDVKCVLGALCYKYRAIYPNYSLVLPHITWNLKFILEIWSHFEVLHLKSNHTDALLGFGNCRGNSFLGRISNSTMSASYKWYCFFRHWKTISQFEETLTQTTKL